MDVSCSAFLRPTDGWDTYARQRSNCVSCAEYTRLTSFEKTQSWLLDRARNEFVTIQTPEDRDEFIPRRGEDSFMSGIGRSETLAFRPRPTWNLPHSKFAERGS